MTHTRVHHNYTHSLVIIHETWPGVVFLLCYRVPFILFSRDIVNQLYHGGETLAFLQHSVGGVFPSPRQGAPPVLPWRKPLKVRTLAACWTIFELVTAAMWNLHQRCFHKITPRRSMCWRGQVRGRHLSMWHPGAGRGWGWWLIAAGGRVLEQISGCAINGISQLCGAWYRHYGEHCSVGDGLPTQIESDGEKAK